MILRALDLVILNNCEGLIAFFPVSEELCIYVNLEISFLVRPSIESQLLCIGKVQVLLVICFAMWMIKQDS